MQSVLPGVAGMVVGGGLCSRGTGALKGREWAAVTRWIATVSDMSYKSVPWSGRLPETLPKKLKVVAAQEGTTIGALIETMLDERLARQQRRQRAGISPLHRDIEASDLEEDFA